MYKKLWKKLNQNHTVAHTSAIYLTVMTLGWMLAGLLVGGTGSGGETTRR